jgi:lipoate-protein ligase A
MDVRLIIDAPDSGAWNMAMDETLREWVQRSGAPALRLYRWSPATLSLGYFQAFGDRRRHPSSESLPVVRRASGGGAIVHDQELTYSFATPARNRFRDADAKLVQTFHQALVETLKTWGIAAHRCAHTVARNPEPFLCFQRRSEHDVLLEGNKIAGSAQRRHRNCVLQHGSILLSCSAHTPELPGIGEISGTRLSVDQLSDQWLELLAQSMGLRFVASQITSDERDRCRTWQNDRFATTRWTEKR